MARVYKGAHVVAAKIVGDSTALDKVAAEIIAAAHTEAARHRDTGSYARSLKIKKVGRHVMDRLVYSDDPAALSIEYGHATRRSANSEGPPKWVPGQFILINAVGAVKRGH